MQDSPSANWRALVIGVLLAVAVFGFAVATRGCISERPGPIGSAGIESQCYLDMRDPEVVKQVERARSELPAFTERLSKPRSGDKDFRVRARFANLDSVEHCWVGSLTRTSTGFDGVLLDEPATIPTLHKGMPVQVADSEVVDWYVLSPDGSIGGYTMQAPR